MFQFSMDLRNATLDVLQDRIGNGAVLRIFSGDPPADCSMPPAGKTLCEIALPAPWLAPALHGHKSMAGDSWNGTGTANAATGTAARYFRIYSAGGKTCHLQGTITHTSGPGDMTLDNISIAQNQTVIVSGFSLTAGNA